MALTDNLVEFWKLADENAEVNGHTLTNTNSVAFASGKIGNGASFTAASSMKLSCTGTDFAPNTDMSVSVWVKPAASLSSGPTRGIIGQVDGWQVRYNGDFGGELYVYDGGGSVLANIGSLGWSADTWHHVVFTYEFGVGSKLYIDGSEVATGGGPGAGSGDLEIGYSADAAAYWDGMIDAVGYWSRALTAGEVTSLYNSGTGVEHPFTTVPDAPTIGTATATSGTTATVAFTPPGNDGGSAITGYTATSTPGSITGTAASSPITVTGLTPGTSYTFTVHATNGVGNSSESSASNSITTPSGRGGGMSGMSGMSGMTCP